MKTANEHRILRKHMFYGVVLVMLFIGSLSSVFRGDFDAKVVSVICSTSLFVMAALLYVKHNKRFP